MVAGICADGSHITPGVVIPRKTIETELYECGYTKEKVSITFQENCFFDTNAFLIWVHAHFFPDIESKIAAFNYTGEAVVILDGVGPHDCDDFLDECTMRGIISCSKRKNAEDGG